MTKAQKLDLRFKKFFDASQDGILIFSHPDAVIENANKYIIDLLGYSKEELVGKKLWELGLFTDQQSAKDVKAELISEGYVRYENLPLVSKAGNSIPVELICNSFPLDGGWLIQCTIHDIRQRVKSDVELAERYVAASLAQLKAMVSTLSNVIESRDPYTAGHQTRVTNLAVAIATELGWDLKTIESLRLASLIHDIGKISVPIEILTKPTTLNHMEKAILRGHVQAGVDILQPLIFEGPVIEIIEQHHERLDGSGYPHGLKGKQIFREARVLAVADTVESMCSDRPYRAALGFDKAAAELVAGSGVLYDPDVVNACLRLFKEKDYKLPTPKKPEYLGIGNHRE